MPEERFPNFNLGQRIADAQPGPDDFDNEAMAAARRVYHRMTIDKKTGLLNQQAWNESLAETLGDLEPGEWLNVYVADLDGFKAVNDKLGHDAGDALLALASEAFHATFGRETDILTHGASENPSSNRSISRLSGDEFGAFSRKKGNKRRSATASEEAEDRMRELENNFNDILKLTPFVSFNIRLSVGYAEYQPGDTAESLIAKADIEMLKNKSGGKVENLTEEDREKLREIVPFLEGIGGRVEGWMKEAAS